MASPFSPQTKRKLDQLENLDLPDAVHAQAEAAIIDDHARRHPDAPTRAIAAATDAPPPLEEEDASPLEDEDAPPAAKKAKTTHLNREAIDKMTADKLKKELKKLKLDTDGKKGELKDRLLKALGASMEEKTMILLSIGTLLDEIEDLKADNARRAPLGLPTEMAELAAYVFTGGGDASKLAEGWSRTRKPKGYSDGDGSKYTSMSAVLDALAVPARYAKPGPGSRLP